MPSLFDFSKAHISWFPMHMRDGLSTMKRMLAKVDVVVEVRDARIPFSSANPLLDTLCRQRKRLILFNKTDLADELSNKDEPKSRVLIVGIPNVGKSTVINRLRAEGCVKGGKAVKTGALPGITRAVSGIVKILEEPLVYLVDSPGILVPKFTNPEIGLKIALTGGILTRVAGEYVLADYLLHLLNERKRLSYVEALGLKGPSEDILATMEEAARFLQGIKEPRPTDKLNTTNAITCFLTHFRKGNFGRFTLDNIPS